jgi:glycosyltransferase involved in cell wall biosynthesis
LPFKRIGKLKISIIIPVFNAERSINALVNAVFESVNCAAVEVILVNDGSSDTSETICEKLARNNRDVKFISLRKNFGEHNAVLCGLNYAEGDYAVIIDDDFQNPPGEINKMIRVAEHGYDVVYSKYKQKKHSLFRNIGSRFNNMMANVLMTKPKDLYLSSFKIISRDMIKEIIKYRGPFPYIDGLILRATNNIGSVEVEHHERAVGKSNYNLKKLFSLYMNMFLNFSLKPLRMFTISGAFLFVWGLSLSAYFIFSKLTSQEIPGWTSTVILILLLSGFQIIFLGLIGEYLGKQYMDQNNTPQWVVKKEILNNQPIRVNAEKFLKVLP